MTPRPLLTLALAGLALAGCAGPEDAPPPSDRGDGKGDRIGPDDDPNLLVEGASFRLADNITADDVGQTFGTDDDHIPYPDSYWPMLDGGIDWRWNGTDSPLEKYMAVADPARAADAKEWEHTRHGAAAPDVRGWSGHCAGWTAAATLFAPLRHAVLVRSDGAGGVVPCSDGVDGCVRFEIGDVNALAAELYVNADEKSFRIGAACEETPGTLTRDENGRIVAPGCQGVNAGALLVVLGTLLKQRRQAFAIDAQTPYNVGEIWNQPAYRYTVHRFEPLDAAEAANLVASGSKDGPETRYRWNEQARGFARVDLGLGWVIEHGPNRWPVSGAQSTRVTRMAMVIELTADPSDPAAGILGGEYVDDPAAGADRLRVPPFVWLANPEVFEELPLSVGPRFHNPYVKPSMVRELIRLGQE